MLPRIKMPADDHLLLSYGDCLEPGTYTLHSEFGKAANYVRGERLLSVVCPQVGGGPANIVLAHMEQVRGSKVEVAGGLAWIGRRRFLLPEARKYRSTLSFCSPDPGRAIRKLNLAARHIIESSHPASLAFLLDEGRRSFFTSGFERHLAARMARGWSCLQRREIEAGVSLIQGSGYGLTPAGDDFLAGLVAGLHLVSRLFLRAVMREMQTISSLSFSGNPISRSFIGFALEGRFTEKIRDLIQLLLSGPETEIPQRTGEVLAMGETSGADFCTGLIGAFRMHGILKTP